MAITTNGGHAQRALDFYNKSGVYFIIGGTSPWDNEAQPPAPSPTTFKLNDVVALKRVDTMYLVVEDDTGSIEYQNKKWRYVIPNMSTTISPTTVSSGSMEIPLASISGIVVNAKLRIGDVYEGKVVSIDILNKRVTLDTAAPSSISPGTPVTGGALVEGASHIYLEGKLNSVGFPQVTYRQVGICVGVTPSTVDLLRSALYSDSGTDEYTSLGVLEVISNTPPIVRNPSMSEKLSVMLEF